MENPSEDAREKATAFIREDDMNRQAILTPIVYGYHDEWNEKPYCCWYCDCIDCCCGGCRRNPQPCAVRVGNCIGSHFFWRAGMYDGAQSFNRGAMDFMTELAVIPAGYDKKLGITAVDLELSSTYSPGAKFALRLFRRDTNQQQPNPIPILFYFHFGGWFVEFIKIP